MALHNKHAVSCICFKTMENRENFCRRNTFIRRTDASPGGRKWPLFVAVIVQCVGGMQEILNVGAGVTLQLCLCCNALLFLTLQVA
jgi:hypothetical protein